MKKVSASSGKSGKLRRVVGRVLVGAAIAALAFLPFKAKADELENAKAGKAPDRPVAARVFTQYGKDNGLEAGFGLFGKFKLRPVTIQMGTEVAGNVLDGNMMLETAHLSVSAPIFRQLSITAYGQASRFLGGQRAVGGVLHLGLDPVTIHAGAEKDIGGPVPIFAGVDIPVGLVTISPTVIIPVNVSGQSHPRTGGQLQVNLDVVGVTVFARGFIMANPAGDDAGVLAGNVQAGMSKSFQEAEGNSIRLVRDYPLETIREICNPGPYIRRLEREGKI